MNLIEWQDKVRDKLYRLQNFYLIKDKNKKLTKLKLNAIQIEMVEDVKGMNPVRYFVLKYRQGGVSTFWLLYWLDETIFNRNVTTGILSHKKESLDYLWDIVRLGINTMPKEIKPRFGDDNKSSISFPDINSKIFVSLDIRSTALHNLHISEWAFCEDERVKASLAAAGPNANITGETTANGIGNDAYLTYQDAKTAIFGDGGFKSRFFPWHIQPEYRIETRGMEVKKSPEELKLDLSDEQILFRRNKKKELKEMFAQEFPEDDQSAFLTSGNPYFNGKKMMALLQETRDIQPIAETHEYTLWENYDKNCTYVAGADVAEGLDGDYSVLTILNVTKRRQVFRYKAHVGVDTFYRICDEWGRKFGNCLLAVERNNHGHAVLLGLIEKMRYPNLFTQNEETRIIKFQGGREQKKFVKYGWETTKITKPMMLDHLKEAIEGDDIEGENEFQPEFSIYDSEFLKECLTIVNDKTKIGAQGNKHDDIVIAWAITFQMYMRLKRRMKSLDEGIYIGDNYQATAIF
jgi:hypothetical protein